MARSVERGMSTLAARKHVLELLRKTDLSHNQTGADSSHSNLVGMRTDTRGFREADPSESLVDLAHDFLDGGLHQVDVRLVGILQLVEKTSPPGLVALVCTAEVEADAARILEKSG